MTKIVPPTDENIEHAASSLREGDVVAFPTETVYGLGADTFNVSALELIYEIKGRPADNPLIAHVLDEVMAREVMAWDDRCEQLAARFWPGPLSIIMPKNREVPDEATAGYPTIATRAPMHPVARKLIAAFGGPISAPSANRSGHVSPTSAKHVLADFPLEPGLRIIDGNRCDVGLESTVVDLSQHPPRILRPGSVSILELRSILPDVAADRRVTQEASPGTSNRHYAPHTPTDLATAEDLLSHLKNVQERIVALCFDESIVPAPHRAIVMPQGAGDYGKKLYDALREADALEFDRIVIETPPASNELWKTIADRLRRAVQQ